MNRSMNPSMITPMVPHAVAALMIAIFGLVTLSCQEPSMECLSLSECDVNSTCVSGRCVGAEVEGSPFELYVNEMHARLVSECGVCHAASEESIPPPTPESNADEERMFTSEDPFRLPVYTAESGDSGWRIYISDLTPERLKASYRDTLHYLNSHAPEQSLLFAYGRGDLGVSISLAHPKLYPTDDELAGVTEAQAEGADYVGYQRLVNWAKLPHAPEDGAVMYDLDEYLETAGTVLGGCQGCHSGDLINTLDEGQGGFAIKSAAEAPEELAPLTPLINFEAPERSALIRFIYGEFDHVYLLGVFFQEEDMPNFERAVITWIESLR